MSDKIVLLDGHSILNRAFYGVPDLSWMYYIHCLLIEIILYKYGSS